MCSSTNIPMSISIYVDHSALYAYTNVSTYTNTHSCMWYRG